MIKTIEHLELNIKSNIVVGTYPYLEIHFIKLSK